MTPYYADDHVTLWNADCRDILPTLARVDCVVTDPPYGETSLAWDRWPDGWPALAATAADSMWCFGSLRMFLTHRDDFTEAGWRLSQDVIWEKQDGSGFAADRFRRVHEHAAHFYRGNWGDVHHDAPRDVYSGPETHHGRHGARRAGITHAGSIGERRWVDDGTRITRSVIKVRNMQGRALHPTQKPSGVLEPLIAYACATGGVVLDPFAGSGSTLVVARMTGRRAVGIEANERYCEVAARWLAQDVLPIGDAS